VGLTTYDASDPDTAYPPIEELRPPPGAPNVLIVLIDDVGFGRRPRSVAHAKHRTSRSSPPVACGTTGSTPPRCVPRTGPTRQAAQ
jgi:hypothetical protein